jgi:hypothetical protein
VRSTTVVSILGLMVVLLLLASPRRVNAQAAPGPIVPHPSQDQSSQPPQPTAKPKPPVPPRTTLAGFWKLNQDESDNGQRKARAADGSSDNTGYPRGGGYPGGYPRGGPWGGYPPGPGAGGPYGGRRNTGQDIEDNPKLQPLLNPSESLTIDLKNPEVDMTDHDFRKLVLYTDGRQIPKSTDDTRQEVAAHWNGDQLISDEKSPLGGKMSRTFELAKDGRKLYETVHIDNGRSKTPIVIQYVYDAASSDAQSGQDADPNRPLLQRNPGDSNPPQ